jgi:superfamily I DNA and/or RNA helicase
LRPTTCGCANCKKAFPGTRVGSVDKFQGQEARVVILSMCSSAGEFGARGLEFLLDKNRMNVAISRAQTLVIVVGDPRIATTQASTVEQMEKLNLFCKLVRKTSVQPVHAEPATRVAD